MANAKNRVTSFGLRNFKAFHYLEDIELKPLTVLVGANSTGKSSIFQSLLLLKQTSKASRFGGVLKFDGDWTKLSNFSTAISEFDSSKILEYRFNINFEIPEAALSGHLPVITPKTLSTAISGQSNVTLGFAVSSDTDRQSIEHFSIRTSFHRDIDSRYNCDLTIRKNSPIDSQNLYVLGHKVHPRLASYDKFWLQSLILHVDQKAQKEPSLALSQLLTGGLSVDVFPALAAPLNAVRRDLEDRLEYLGPLRADPRAFYPVEEDPDIGLRGEGAIPYLLRHQHDEIEFVIEPRENARKAPLLEAMNTWLGRMGVTSRLTIDPLESIAYTATVQSRAVRGKSVNLAQVGFGISQLLPVLVTGLKNPSDAWLLLEQPEIHLHPRLQGELGDFLLCAAKAGKTIMVETHSDHLVNRIRRRIAEDETGNLASMVQILFVHAGTDDNPSSYVEPLQVDESGTIINCPPDFFSEAPDEAFAILQAQRRKAKKAAP